LISAIEVTIIPAPIKPTNGFEYGVANMIFSRCFSRVSILAIAVVLNQLLPAIAVAAPERVIANQYIILKRAVAGLKIAHLPKITAAFEFSGLTLTVPGLRP